MNWTFVFKNLFFVDDNDDDRTESEHNAFKRLGRITINGSDNKIYVTSKAKQKQAETGSWLYFKLRTYFLCLRSSRFFPADL